MLITRPGNLESVTTKGIENLFACDLAYLQELYQRINHEHMEVIKAICPKCEYPFTMKILPPGK